jgi:hypothetical protein
MIINPANAISRPENRTRKIIVNTFLCEGCIQGLLANNHIYPAINFSNIGAFFLPPHLLAVQKI